MGSARSSPASQDLQVLEAARNGDEEAFGQLVEPHRAELHAHCYRMLGSVHDAEDALQEALLGAWRGLAGFEGRSSLRTWLYTIATNACIRQIARRPRRVLAGEHGPNTDPRGELGEPLTEPIWVEPYPDDQIGVVDGPASPEARYEQRESVELAFVAALQHLPGTQRAVIILREVLGFSAAEVAAMLGTTVPSVNSALQRARRSLDERLPGRSQQATLRALGDEGALLVERFLGAWERADVDGILALLSEDATFTMPPLPAWFRGRTDIGAFLRERVFANRWRFVRLRASGQPALACYMADAAGRFPLSALNVLSLRGAEISRINSFLDPAVTHLFGLPDELPAGPNVGAARAGQPPHQG